MKRSMKEQILEALRQTRRPVTGRQLSKALGITRRYRGEFFSVLDSLVEDNKIYKISGKYSLDPPHNMVEATIVKVNETYGFATPVEEGKDDIFIPGRFMMGGLVGDTVLIEVSPSSKGDSSEGKVKQIISQSNQPFAATVIEDERGRWQLMPDTYTKFAFEIDRQDSLKAKPGDKVLAVISHRGNSHFAHKASITQVFGDANYAWVSAEAILAEQGISTVFPEEVKRQAKDIQKNPLHPKEVEVRTDLRDWPIFTIDGADTKDIDDAISIKKDGEQWQLGVHIADVSYYVLPDSPIDKEAYKRGTSVYYADKVVPMLPVELSNDVCSLNPGADRLAFSALLTINSAGELVDFRFEKTIINSVLQGVYSEINDIFKAEDGEAVPNIAELKEKYHEVYPLLFHMRELANILQEKRFQRGGVHLESKESKIITNAKGIAVDVEARTSGESEGIIEEFMLMANQAAATFSIDKTLPFIYRIHDKPNGEKLEVLYYLLDTLGISYRRASDNPTGKDLDQILDAVADTPVSGVVNNLVLRSMAKAIYSADNIGHFGLGLSNYSHFTAPIRRYPDIAIHRIMTGLLTGMRRDTIERNFGDWVVTTSRQSSDRELAALQAERACEDCYKAEYMSSFVGEEFSGIISGVTSFGVFAALDNTVEGFIALSDLPSGNWEFDEMLSYKNAVGGETLRVGDRVKLQLVRTNVAAGEIDFIMLEKLELEPTKASADSKSK